EFIQTDCEADIGISELLRAIQRETDRLPNVRDPFPASWFTVKNELASLRDNYIGYDAYQHLCAGHGIAGAVSQETLVGFLHDLGIVVNFRDNPRLSHTHVLNPSWVTNGIYKLLNDETLMQKKDGEFSHHDLARVLDAAAYPASMYQFLLDLMEKFELCYEFYDSNGRYLVPELLKKEEPGLPEFVTADALRFEYHYNILPEGLLPRFIVRSRGHNQELPRWRTGAVLAFEGNRALVKADIQDRTVSITVNGDLAGRRRLLTVIRSDFERLHSSIIRLQAEEKVPVPHYAGTSVEYKTLCVMEAEGEKELPLVVGGKLVRVNVAELLNGVEEPSARRRDAAQELRAGMRETVSVVFSYSHKDEELRDKLAAHLKILERNGVITSWYDRKIPPGDEWKRVIDTNFERADVILLLVSADFIASDYCYEVEMKGALERHEKREARVVPIIARPCRWQTAPFGRLQV